MKITFEKDRIRWQAETRKESNALLAVHDLMFLSSNNYPDSIVNDLGCVGDYNYVCTPLPQIPKDETPENAKLVGA